MTDPRVRGSVTGLIRRLWPLIKFSMVGVVNTLVYYGVYLALYLFTPYVIAHLIGWTVSVVVSYLLNCRFTYHVKPTWRKLFLFPLSSLPNVLFTTFGVVFLVEVLFVSKTWAPLIAGLVAVPFSYLFAKFILVGRGSVTTLSTEKGDAGASAE